MTIESDIEAVDDAFRLYAQKFYTKGETEAWERLKKAILTAKGEGTSATEADTTCEYREYHYTDGFICTKMNITCKHYRNNMCNDFNFDCCLCLRSAGKCPKPKATGRKITTPYQCNTATERNGGIVEKEMEKAAVHVKEGDATQGVREQVEEKLKRAREGMTDNWDSIIAKHLWEGEYKALTWVLTILPAHVVQQLPESKK